MAFPVDMQETDGQTDGTDEGPSVAQLQAELEAEREAGRARDNDLERERARVDQFLAGQSRSGAETTTASPPPMPDPVESPEAYREWLIQREAARESELQSQLRAHREELRSEIQTAETRATLWQDFKERYPEHAKRRELAGAAYQMLHSANALPSTTEGIADAIAKKMDSMVGTPIKPGSTKPDRAIDLSGGEKPKPARPASADPGSDEEVTMHDAISKFQMEHNLI